MTTEHPPARWILQHNQSQPRRMPRAPRPYMPHVADGRLPHWKKLNRNQRRIDCASDGGAPMARHRVTPHMSPAMRPSVGRCFDPPAQHAEWKGRSLVHHPFRRSGPRGSAKVRRSPGGGDQVSSACAAPSSASATAEQPSRRPAWATQPLALGAAEGAQPNPKRAQAGRRPPSGIRTCTLGSRSWR